MTDLHEISASRSALLELRRERELIEQGHRFLDEKRIQLARELLHRLDAWKGLLNDLDTAESEAAQIFADAVAAYGILDIASHPGAEISDTAPKASELRFLGLNLPTITLDLNLAGRARQPAVDRPLLDDVGQRYTRIAEIAATGAGMLTAMFRLDAEYKRTERSVRALENVVMPEVREQEKATEEVLAEREQEEAVRVRLFARQN